MAKIIVHFETDDWYLDERFGTGQPVSDKVADAIAGLENFLPYIFNNVAITLERAE